MLNRTSACVAVLAVAGIAFAAAPVTAASAESEGARQAAAASGRAVMQGAVALKVTRKASAVKVKVTSNSSRVRVVAKLASGAKVARLGTPGMFKVSRDTVVVKARTAGSDVIASGWTKVKVPHSAGGSASGSQGAPAIGPGTGSGSSPAPGVSADEAAYEAEVFRLTNVARGTARACGSTSYPPAPALARNAKIDAAAHAHSKDMAISNYFAHESRNGDKPWDRMTAAGYRWSNAGENIAKGYPTAAAVVNGWISSPGHCSNLMSATYTEIGVGAYRNGSGQWLATQDFGRPR